jgi:hypothetical protein
MLRPVSLKQGIRIETKKLSVLRVLSMILITWCRKVTRSFLAEEVKTSGRRYEVEELLKDIVRRIARCASGLVDERQSMKESISPRD